jgi:hypothetical protein
MSGDTRDRRRYRVIETQFHQHGQVAIYTLRIGGEIWAQVEWSPRTQGVVRSGRVGTVPFSRSAGTAPINCRVLRVT